MGEGTYEVEGKSYDVSPRNIKCKLYLAWPTRKSNNDFEFEIHECIETLNMDNTEKNVSLISSKIASFYEKMIKAYPDQYFWFHNRWKLK